MWTVQMAPWWASGIAALIAGAATSVFLQVDAQAATESSIETAGVVTIHRPPDVREVERLDRVAQIADAVRTASHNLCTLERHALRTVTRVAHDGVPCAHDAMLRRSMGVDAVAAELDPDGLADLRATCTHAPAAAFDELCRAMRPHLRP